MRGLIFGRFVVRGVVASVDDFDRRNLLASNECIEVEKPFFAEGPDIQIDAVEGG